MNPAVATVEVLVKPRSKRDRIGEASNGGLAIAVTSPPVDGRANKHVVKLVAKKLRVPQSTVSIVRGAGSKRKVLVVEGWSKEDILATLKA